MFRRAENGLRRAVTAFRSLWTLTALMTLTTLGASVAVAVTACGDSSRQTAVPLPQAWPRTPLYDSVYTVIDSLPASFSVNASARLTVKPADSNTGVDIAYPAYHATIYMTIVPGLGTRDAMEKVWQARRDRIDANLGGISADVSAVDTPSGWRGALVRTRSASQTPVQLLVANRDRGVMVTATAFLHDPVTAANLDSVSPTADALEADLRRLAESLQ